MESKELNRFNWGAFYFTWIWGIWYQKWVTFLVFLNLAVCLVFAMLLLAVPQLITLTGLALLCPLIHLILSIWFGRQGNQWAWETGRYKTVEDLHKAQKNWGVATFIFFLLNFLGYVANIVLNIALLGSTSGGIRTKEYEVGYLKAKSTLSMAITMNAALDLGTVSAYASSLDSLINGIMTNIGTGTKTRTEDGFILTSAGGDESSYKFKLLNNTCNDDSTPCAAVIVDTNGSKPPNKRTESVDDLSDRFMLYIYDSKVEPKKGSVEEQLENKY